LRQLPRFDPLVQQVPPDEHFVPRLDPLLQPSGSDSPQVVFSGRQSMQLPPVHVSASGHSFPARCPQGTVLEEQVPPSDVAPSRPPSPVAPSLVPVAASLASEKSPSLPRSSAHPPNGSRAPTSKRVLEAFIRTSPKT
jgi:hypothetical protein